MHIKKAFLKLLNFINPKMGDVKVVFPIGIKLVVLFALVLFTVLIIINGLMSGRASQNLEISTAQANSALNSLMAAETENRLNLVRKDVYLLLDFIQTAGQGSNLANLASSAFFEQSFFIAAIYVPGFTELINDRFFINSGVNPDSVSSWFTQQNIKIMNVRQGEPLITNPSKDFGIPLLAMFYPWQRNNSEETVVILFSPDGIAEIFGHTSNTSFIANTDGELLFHTSYRKMLDSPERVTNDPLFAAFAKTNAQDIQIIYTENKVKFFGAGKKLPLGNLMVFTSQEYDLPFKGLSAIFRRNIFLIISTVFIAIIFVWLMSKTITVPVYRLLEAVRKMEEGTFKADLKYRFPDEIGVLSQRFNTMEKNLAAKERVTAVQEQTPVQDPVMENKPPLKEENIPVVKTKSRRKKSR